VASLAAARAARDAMATGLRLRPAVSGGPVVAGSGRGGTAQQTARAGELAGRVLAGGAAAQERAAAAGHDVPAGKSPPSCTFVGALVERTPEQDSGLLVAGWVGDSRAYWLPDDAQGVQVSRDDSWAAEAMAQGLPRAEAETMPQSHAITRWLGADAPDPVPHTAVVALDRSGWVLLCSDGLWNYCSDPVALSELVGRTWSALGPDAAPVELAEALVAWAIDQGGHDNITVALARFDPAGEAGRPDDGPQRDTAQPEMAASAPGPDGAPMRTASMPPGQDDGTVPQEGPAVVPEMPEQAGV
jgi:serine/threonine protein phosphatase PrpC